MTREEILKKVSVVLVEALNLDEDQINLAARLEADLGAEEIDFLDIIFRLEQEFGIKISRDELFPESIFQQNPDFVQNGKVTTMGILELKKIMPDADIDSFAKNPDFCNIPDLQTVGYVVSYVIRKLSEKNS